MPRKPPIGRRFEKGHAPLPGAGRPKIPYELEESKRLTSTSFQLAVNKLVAMSRAELNAFLASPYVTNLEIMIAGQIKAAASGKTTPISFLLDRTIGPLKQQFKVEVEGSMSMKLASMTEEEKQKRLDQIKARLAKSQSES